MYIQNTVTNALKCLAHHETEFLKMEKLVKLILILNRTS
jgi:hypothetical protein